MNTSAQSINFVNKGAIISIKPATPFIIQSASQNANFTNSGFLKNESSVIIQGSFTNSLGDTTEATATSEFYLLKDWTNHGTFISGQSTVFLNGANQAIKGSSPTPFHHLTLTGSAIKSMQQDASVSGILTLNDLELATDTNTMTVLNTDSNAISRISGFVSSLGKGRLTRAMNDSLDYYFPLGSNSGTFRYRPLIITPSDTDHTIVSARLANTDATVEGYDRSEISSDICTVNPLFYHQIEKTHGVKPVDITMFYDRAEDGLWSQISHWQNIPQWELAGLSALLVDTQFTSLTIEDWNDFSYPAFALMLPSTLLDTTKTVITHVSCYGENDGSICVGYPPLTGTPPFHYSWSTGDTTNCINNLIASTYTLSVSDSASLGCGTRYSFDVTQPNPIDILKDVTDASCKGYFDGSICLTVTGDNPPFIFQWIGGNQNCLGGLGEGSYSVTITDATGCDTILQIPITEPSLLIASAEGFDVSCYGFNDGEGIATAGGGTKPYSYLWENSETNDTITALSPDSYGVVITDSNGCTASSSITITQPDSLIVTAGYDTTIFAGSSASLNVIGVTGGKGSVTYEWASSTNVANPTSPNTSITPDETSTLTVTVTDENGCTAADTVHIQVDVHLYTFPDAFVPNGHNATFFPVKSSTVEVLELKIFNRWGQLVFAKRNPDDGWDGKYKGEMQPMDTYVYQSVLQLPDGTQQKEQGDFILIW